MSYYPSPVPGDPAQLPEFLSRELHNIRDAIGGDAVLYRPGIANQGSLTAGVSANYKLTAGNVIRISSSVTITFTGLAAIEPQRELVLFNVGTGVVVLKSEGTESSASFRFSLPANWNLSANAAAVLWRDPYSARWRGLSRT